MKQGALEQYTKQKKLYGQNQQEILDKFVQYANVCSDPMSIYKYMEEKSICIYLANYWTSRANLFAEMGDFRNALLCLKEAASRNHIVNETQVRIDESYERIRKKMIIAMKRVPPKGKRSANQYNFIYESNQTKVSAENLENLVDVFEKNYRQAKKQVEKEFQLKMHGKKKSWIDSLYEQNQQNIRKISEKMKSLNNFETFLSMRTPISKKDPMRLTKTMDSVEMLKKKKSTQQKDRKQKLIAGNNQKVNENDQNNGSQKSHSDQQNANDDSILMMNTTPVGRQLNLLSRRVTFDAKNAKSKKFDQIQKLRGQQRQKSKNNESNQEKQKSEDQQNVQRSKSISKRGSILKNKRIEPVNMDDED